MRAKEIVSCFCALIISAGLFGCAQSGSSSSDESSAAESSEAVTTASPVTTAAPVTTEKSSSGEAPSEAETEKDSSSEIELIVDPMGELMNTLPDKELENKAVKRLSSTKLDPAADGSPFPSLKLFEKKYGGRIEEEITAYSERYNALASSVMSGTGPDIIPTDEMDLFPKAALHKLIIPIEDYIDLDSELWQDTRERSQFFNFSGDIYAAVIEAVPKYVFVYNTKTIADNSLTDPAELFSRRDWNYDSFEEMCTAFSGGRGKAALDGQLYPMALSESSGLPLITMESGFVITNIKDDRLADTQSWMYDLARSAVCVGSGETGNGIAAGRTLFRAAELRELSDAESLPPFGDAASGEVMFVPAPESPSGVQYMSAQLRGYYLCYGSRNPEGAAVYLNCLKAAKELDNEESEQLLRARSGWTDQMLEMRRECYSLAERAPVIDCSSGMPRGVEEGLYHDAVSGTVLSEDKALSWEEVLERYRKQVEYAVLTTNDTEPIGP